MITSGIAGRPAGTVQVNPRAPRAGDLLGAWFGGHATAGQWPDLIGNMHIALSSARYGPTPYGLAPSGSGAANSAGTSRYGPRFVRGAVVGFTLDTTNNGHIAGQGADEFNTANWDWAVYVYGGALRINVVSAGLQGGYTIYTGRQVSAGLTRGPEGCYTYYNGALVNSYAGMGASASTNPVRLGTLGGGFGAAPMNGSYDYMLLFSCPLSAAEHKAIAANPYQYFRPAGRSLWYTQAAASGSNSFLFPNWQGGYQDFTGGYIG